MKTIDKNLLQLIQNMSGLNDQETPKGSDTISWNAYQIAREINDVSLVVPVFHFINSTEDVKLRKHAYQLLLFILDNTKDDFLANQLLTQLKKEDQNDDCLYTLLIGLWESKMALNNHINNVIFYIDDQRELIRNAAIRLLGLYQNDCDSAENALIEIIENPYDNYDLKYAIETLSIVGSKKCIVPLKKVKNETENFEIQQLITETIKELNQK